MPKNKKSNAVVFSDVQQVAALRKSIYGNKACEEMFWADTLVLCSRAGRAEAARASGVSAEQAAAYGRALQPHLDRVVEALCAAAYRGNPRPFEQLAKCVEWACKSGRGTARPRWDDELAQQLIKYAGRPGGCVNVEDFFRVTGCESDRKTVLKRIRELGFSTKAGRPKKT